MARVPFVNPGAEHPDVTPVYKFMEVRYGRVLNMFRVFANAPHVAEGIFLLFGRLFSKDSLVAERVKHLAVMATDRENNCRYCIAAHDMGAPQLNITPEQIKALNQRFYEDRFDELERAVITYAIDVTNNVAASPESFRAVARYFTPAEMVELTAAIGFYNMLNRLNESLQVELDF